MKSAERKLQLQAIYEEIQKSAPSDKVNAYFKSQPYHLRKGKEVKNGKN